MHIPTPTRQLIGDTYYWVAANGHVGGPCNLDEGHAASIAAKQSAVIYTIDFDATYGFVAMPSVDDADIFLLPGNCLSEAQAFAERIGLKVAA